MPPLGHGEKNSWRAHVFQNAADNCRKRAVPELTISANCGLSPRREIASEPLKAPTMQSNKFDGRQSHGLRHEFCVSPETAMSRIAPNARPTTPRAENTKTCQPLRFLRSGSLKKSVSSLLIGITGKSCARLAQEHQIAPRFFAAGTVHQSSATPASQKTSTQGITLKVCEPTP